jgi:hypothetical protein
VPIPAVFEGESKKIADSIEWQTSCRTLLPLAPFLSILNNRQRKRKKEKETEAA